METDLYNMCFKSVSDVTEIIYGKDAVFEGNEIFFLRVFEECVRGMIQQMKKRGRSSDLDTNGPDGH